MQNRFALASLATIALLAGHAAAQPNLVTDPSFEQDDPTGATAPLGWLDFNMSTSPSTEAAHTGQRSLKMHFGFSNFAGSTTNYLDPDTFMYPYDPVIIYLGGPITVSGWYMIPADHPITGTAWASIKLQVRRTVNNSSYQDFEWPVITGSTNGQWVFFTRTVQNADFQEWPLPPTPGQPTRCSVVPEMFDTDPVNYDRNTIIYWDDITLTQSAGPTCYANCDGSTATPFLNVNDFICFQGRFAAGDSYANCDGSTSIPVLNVNDFICFQGRFAAGCSAP